MSYMFCSRYMHAWALASAAGALVCALSSSGFTLVADVRVHEVGRVLRYPAVSEAGLVGPFVGRAAAFPEPLDPAGTFLVGYYLENGW